MTEGMKAKKKKGIKALGEIHPPLVDPEQYKDFFQHPCWWAIKHEVLKLIDSASDVVYNSGNDLNAINRARGMIDGLMFIENAEESMLHIISAEKDEIEKSRKYLEQIQAIVGLLDK